MYYQSPWENRDSKNIPESNDERMAPKIGADEILDMNQNFDLSDYQVVRREFFAHLREPAVTFDKCKFYVNAACLGIFPGADYAQVLVNRESKILALKPCREMDKDAYQWCRVAKGKRVPKHITCKIFFAKIFDLMGWNPEYRYKLLGNVIHSNGLYLLAFDLKSTEVYQRMTDGDKVRASRKPVFPAEWQDQFGLPFDEHKKAMQVDIFDGYAVISISKEKEKDTSSEKPRVINEESGLKIGSMMGAQMEVEKDARMSCNHFY